MIPLIAATLLAAAPLWSGDYNTCDLGQWNNYPQFQPGMTDRLLTVSEPVWEGPCALKATVKYGDLHSNGARAEVVLTDPRFFEGDEVWFHWATLFPADFKVPVSWGVFTQWHQSLPLGNGGPPLGFYLHPRNGKPVMGLRVMGGVYDSQQDWEGGKLWEVPLVTGQWIEFLVRVKWSVKWDVGFIEMWVNGALVVPKTYTANLDTDGVVYLKQGMYRDRQTTTDTVVFHDGMRIYTADPRPVEQPDAGHMADAGTSDGGSAPIPDAGQPPVDAGESVAPPAPDAGPPADLSPPASSPRPNGCGGSTALALMAVLGVAILSRPL